MEVTLAHIYILMISSGCSYFKGRDRILWVVLTIILLALNRILE